MATSKNAKILVIVAIIIFVAVIVINNQKSYNQTPVNNTPVVSESVSEDSGNNPKGINSKLGADYSKLTGEASPEYRYTEFRATFIEFVNSNPSLLVDEDSYRTLTLDNSGEYSFLNRYPTRYLFRKTGEYPDFAEYASVSDFPEFIRKLWDNKGSEMRSGRTNDARIGYVEAVNTAGERWAFVGVIYKTNKNSPWATDNTAVAVRIN